VNSTTQISGNFHHIYEKSESIFISEFYHTKHYKSMNDGINQNKPHTTRIWQEVMSIQWPESLDASNRWRWCQWSKKSKNKIRIESQLLGMTTCSWGSNCQGELRGRLWCLWCHVQGRWPLSLAWGFLGRHGCMLVVGVLMLVNWWWWRMIVSGRALWHNR